MVKFLRVSLSPMTLVSNSYTVTITCNKQHDPTKYNDSLKKFGTITTVGNLSSVLRLVPQFTNAKHFFNLNMFRDNISPSWEDEANVEGCSWSIQVKPEFANMILEKLSLYFFFYGFRSFEANGISANIRKHFVKFTIWSKNILSVADGSDVLFELRTAFGFADDVFFLYKNHKNLLETVFEFEKSAKGTVNQ